LRHTPPRLLSSPPQNFEKNNRGVQSLRHHESQPRLVSRGTRTQEWRLQYILPTIENSLESAARSAWLRRCRKFGSVHRAGALGRYAKALALSGTRFRTPLLVTTSTAASGRGISSALPSRNSIRTLGIFIALARAFCSMAAVMSIPHTFPSEPTNVADSKASVPDPAPTSRTRSPSESPLRQRDNPPRQRTPPPSWESCPAAQGDSLQRGRPSDRLGNGTACEDAWQPRYTSVEPLGKWPPSEPLLEMQP
jgi:hypothetical protein